MFFWVFAGAAAWTLRGRQPGAAPSVVGGAGKPINGTNSTTLPPCNWTADEFGLARPAYCVDNATGNATCQIVPAFPADNCTKPLLLDCMNLPNLGMVVDYYRIGGNGTAHGAIRTITCAEVSMPTSMDYEATTWGTDSYRGPNATTSMCNNGTWNNVTLVNMAVAKPQNLSCFTMEQINRLKEMLHYVNVTAITLNATAKVHFKWIDSTANMRNATLRHALLHSERLYKEALAGNMPSVNDFDIVIGAMRDNAMEPRGRPFSADTCGHLEQQFLYELKVPPGEHGPVNTLPDGITKVPLTKPVGLSCMYTLQKSSISWDYINSKPIFFYRDGCACQSDWIGGCPWRIEFAPNYKAFGFSSMDTKVVSTTVGSPQPNALCWYWSDPTHPERGFIDHPSITFQAPLKNGTDLLRATNQ
eukprot:GEMP01013613.1.p1 GENE.GEMP01013613.1~~GEMP01013613.1.p1  ORF type:complete len:417 (+),score=91.53 GEMP01013613.1:51-1301(+)